MAFNLKKFQTTRFEHRTAEVSVPDLKDFFADEESPVWKVRGLTGHELGRAKEATRRAKNYDAIFAKLSSNLPAEVAEAVEKLSGLSDEKAEDIVYRLHQLKIGSIEPKIEHSDAVRLCETFPVIFYQLTNKILELTGAGQSSGESNASGETTE